MRLQKDDIARFRTVTSLDSGLCVADKHSDRSLSSGLDETKNLLNIYPDSARSRSRDPVVGGGVREKGLASAQSDSRDEVAEPWKPLADKSKESNPTIESFAIERHVVICENRNVCFFRPPHVCTRRQTRRGYAKTEFSCYRLVRRFRVVKRAHL